MIKKMELFLLKDQGSLNLNYTAAGAVTFAGTDLLEVLDGSTIDSEQATEQVVNVAGALDQDASVPGEIPSKGTLNMKMIPATGNGDSLPDWARCLVSMCAFSSSQTTESGSDNFVLTPTSNMTTAGILQHFTGSLETSAAIKTTHYNCISDWKITLTANKAPEISFPLVGACYGAADATQPSVTKSRVPSYALKGATISISGSTTYRLISGEITGNQSPQNTSDPSQANGMGVSKTTDRKIKFTAKVYQDTIAVNDPKSKVNSASPGLIQFKWGTAPALINIQGSYAQITKSQRGEQNGITTWDIEGQFNRNDFKIEINPV